MSDMSRGVAARALSSSATTPRQAKCRVPGCDRLTQRASQSGLSEQYCKRHVEFHRRHGSFWKRSITATDLGPYRRAARRWLRGHRKDRSKQAVISKLDELLASSGEPISAYDLRGMPATERARAVFAQLSAKGVLGARLMEITLAVATYLHDVGFADSEFLRCQISKCAFRAAGGTHFTTSGFRLRSKYPHSAGRVLRVFGSQVWDIAAFVVTHQAIHEVSMLAQPYASELASKRAKRAKVEERVAREILRVQRAGMGPERLKQYRSQLRRHFGLTAGR